MFFVFIWPILKYADFIWDNCADKQKLEQIQLEAARITMSATKLISINNLYKETGWDTLQERRRKHKLLYYFKMTNELCPQYLNTLVPARVGDNVNYSLRNSSNISRIKCKTKLYSESFLPSVIKEWNSLPQDVRNTDSAGCFKRKLNKNVRKIPTFYYSGHRNEQILHTRLRTECSSLNEHLFNCNVIDSPYCICGLPETSDHFFFHCPIYNNIRRTVIDTVTRC